MSTAVTPMSFDPAIFSNEDVVGLRRTICAEPKENTHRLVLADKLEELRCDEWAELIRVQIRLAQLPPAPIQVTDAVISMPYGPNYYALTGGEDTTKGGRLIMDPALKVGARVDILNGKTLKSKKGKNVYGLRITKLLEDEIILVEDEHSKPWKGWDDFKRSGALVTILTPWMRAVLTTTGLDWLISVKFIRGLLGGITCSWDWWTERGVACVEEWPIESVNISDWRPDHIESDLPLQLEEAWWYTPEVVPTGAPDNLPQDIFDLLEDGVRMGDRVKYSTSVDAIAAVSKAVVTWANKRK